MLFIHRIPGEIEKVAHAFKRDHVHEVAAMQKLGGIVGIEVFDDRRIQIEGEINGIAPLPD